MNQTHESPYEVLYRFATEKSFSILQAHAYLLGYGFDVAYGLTKSMIKQLEYEGVVRHIGSHDMMGSPVYVPV